MNLPAHEAESLAYAEGFTGTARLFARIADMQKALGEATVEIQELVEALEWALGELDDSLDPDFRAGETAAYATLFKSIQRG